MANLRRGALVLYCSTLLAIALLPRNAAAQEPTQAPVGDQAASSDLIELPFEQLMNVMVTAQKREENIQDVPIAITVFNAEALRADDIADVAGLGKVTANATFDGGTPFSGSTPVLSAFIRGIGQDDFAFNLDPGVGVYVDGVYLARSIGANADLLDVDRVEILKGPQGTLFGRNTIGGAVSIVTRDPGKVFHATADVTTGSYGRLDVRGSMDLPLAEHLTAGLAFSSKKRDGYQKRIPFPAPLAGSSGIPDCDLGQPAGTPCAYVTDPPYVWAGNQTSEREGGQDEWNLRGKLLWEASDRLKVTLSADYTDIDQSAMANTLFATDVSPNGVFGFLYNLCIGTPAPVLGAIGLGLLCGPRGTVGTPIAGVNVDGDPNNNMLPYDSRFVTGDIDTSYATGNSFVKLKTYGGAGIVDFKLSDTASLKSITAYRRLSYRVGTDLGGAPIAIQELSFDTYQHQFSEELQLTGTAFDKRLTYVFGGYYFREAGDFTDFPTFAGGLLQIYGPNTLATRTWAGYAHLNYKLSKRLSITVGGRYTREDKAFEGGQTDLNAFNYKISGCYPPSAPSPVPGLTCQQFLGFSVPGQPLRYYPAGLNEQSFSGFTPKVGAEFRASDAMMIYASYSQGFKSGGWTTRLSNPIPDAAATAFGPETADTYEVGLKSELFDRRVRLNLAGFYTRYTGIQLNIQEGVSPTLHNAGGAEIHGVDAEVQAVLTRAFSIDASLGYAHNRYTELDPRVIGITLSSKLQKTPEWKFNIRPQYVIDLPNTGALQLNAGYTHTSSFFNDPLNTPLIKRRPTDILDASVTYKAPGERWELTVGGTNILNDRYIVTGLFAVTTSAGYATYSRPPEWYARLRANF